LNKKQPRNISEIINGIKEIEKQYKPKKWMVCEVRNGEHNKIPTKVKPLLSPKNDVLLIAIEIPREKLR
jgi:hypothetical protein